MERERSRGQMILVPKEGTDDTIPPGTLSPLEHRLEVAVNEEVNIRPATPISPRLHLTR
jgi:hypothetical protein